MATGLLVAAIVVGSRNLQNFDPALVIYTFAVIFATWGIVYHYAVWLQQAADAPLFERTFELIRVGGVLRSTGILAATAGTHLLGQTFIASGRTCAGGCTSCCSGAACSPSRSRSRWSSAGSTSGRRPTTR